MTEMPGGRVLPYMGSIGTCGGIGYSFRGSRFLKRYFFNIVVTVFLVWSLDRVAKLYYLILECENGRLKECLGLKKGCILRP